MRFEQMNELIETIVHFGPQKVRPLRLLWRGRPLKVKTVRGRWTTVEGQQKCYHWAVVVDGVGPCELSLDVDRMAWHINTVAVEN